MKFDTKALLAATEAAIRDASVRHSESLVRWELEEETRKDEWHAKEGPRWEQACAHILAVLAEGDVVTREMLPRGRHGYDPTWFSPERPWDGNRLATKPPSQFTIPRELAAMKATLAIISDPEVSATGLRNLGFTSAMLQTVIHWLGRTTK